MHHFRIAAFLLLGTASLVANAQPRLLLIEAGRVLEPPTGAYRAQQGIVMKGGRVIRNDWEPHR